MGTSTLSPAIKTSLALCSLLTLSLAACGSEDGEGSPTDAGGQGLVDASPGVPDSGPDGAVTDGGQRDASAADAGVDTGVMLDPSVPSAFLSETGLYANPEQTTLAAGVSEYKVRYELWADGATKKRFVYLPPSTQIDTHDPDAWVFPIGTKIWKEFTRDGKRVETRLIEKAANGQDGWKYVAYAWNAEQTRAEAVPLGRTAALGTDHDIPTQTNCYDCHGGNFDFAIGVSAFGLFADGDGVTLASLTRDARLTTPISAGDVVIPGNAAAQAALGTLNANCAHCHRPGTFAYERANLDLRVTVGVHDVAQTPIYKTSVGMAVGQIFENVPNRIKAGSPMESAVYTRMISRTDKVGMPNVGTKVADLAGAQLVSDWIRSLTP